MNASELYMIYRGPAHCGMINPAEIVEFQEKTASEDVAATIEALPHPAPNNN